MPIPTPTPTPTPTPALPPQVVQIAGVDQPPKGLTAVLVVFNEAMLPASVLDPGLYRLLGGVKKQSKTAFIKVLRIRSVLYDANTNTATVVLARPFLGVVEATVQGLIAAVTGATNNVSVTTVVA